MSQDAPDIFKSIRASCDAHRVQSTEYAALIKEGDFYIKAGYITMWLPGLTKQMGTIHLPLDVPHGWKWNGNADKPTLTPSIKISVNKPNDIDPPEKWPEIELWHGHLRDGRMESC